MSVEVIAANSRTVPTSQQMIFRQLETVAGATTALTDALNLGAEVTIVQPAVNPVLIAVSDTAQRLETTENLLLAKSIKLVGFKALLATGGGTINGDNIFIGFASDELPTVLGPGATISIGSPGTKHIDLFSIYIIGKIGDGVYVEAFL